VSFRTSARNLFRRLLGRPLVGESPYAEIRDGYSGELREDVKSTQEPWKEVSASTYRWVRPSEVQKAMPPLEEEPTVAPKEPETDPVDQDKRPLLCEKFLVQDQLKIDPSVLKRSMHMTTGSTYCVPGVF
jgi:hypothetical protein